jgi:hypothetical protein
VEQVLLLKFGLEFVLVMVFGGVHVGLASWGSWSRWGVQVKVCRSRFVNFLVLIL